MITRHSILFGLTTLSIALCASADEALKLRGIRLLTPSAIEATPAAKAVQEPRTTTLARDCEVHMRGVRLTAGVSGADAAQRDCPEPAHAATPAAQQVQAGKAAVECDKAARGDEPARVAAATPLTIRGVKLRGIRLLDDPSVAKPPQAHAGPEIKLSAVKRDCDNVPEPASAQPPNVIPFISFAPSIELLFGPGEAA
jgi:hypothetical protein